MTSTTPLTASGQTTTNRTTAPDVDEERLQQFLQRFAADQAATLHAATVLVGDQLGLYRALADGGQQTPQELAAATGCNPRLVQEWVRAQAASGYCEHADGRYWLTPEQAACLADDSSATFVAGGAMVTSSAHKDTQTLIDAFASDGAVGWGEHHTHLFDGTRRFFEPAYRGNLVDAWIPALDGMVERLRNGARVADVGCGHGLPLLLLAEAYPTSTFVGFDPHAESIDAARRQAADAGVADRVSFEVAGAEEFGGRDYDLICVFNALHEWGDPTRAAEHIRRALGADGTWMFTEPRTDDELIESTRARTFYSVSSLVCTPSAIAQGADDPLGAQAGEDRLREVVLGAGFSRFRRATETPTFMVLEARP